MAMNTMRRVVVLLAVGLLGVSILAVVISSRASSAPVAPRESRPAADVITCLGRISPDGNVIRLSARSLSGQPSLVAELRVREGDNVTRDQVLAVLNSRDQLEAAWRAAEARADVAERRLAQVRAGVKPADLSAQRAEIGRLEAELRTLKADLARFEALHTAVVISAAEFDAKTLAVDAKALELRQATERLNSLAEVRDVDVALAEAEVASARMAARVAKSEYEQAEVRSPIDGRVVEIHTWPGEEVKPAGIMELAKIDRMYVVAEVFERDVARVRPGQQASITGEALRDPLHGIVERVGTKVAKNDVLNVDPTAMSDSRVVETWIRLDDPARASGLIHGQVTVRITP